jgi:signal transduction histidine kinase
MADRPAPRVLVVDDTEGNRYATTRILRTAGFEVLEAGTGGEALARLRDDPDVVILDVNLPDMTGFDVVERMRRLPESAGVPVLHLSASYTSPVDQTRGLDTGADAYLTHPIEPTVFIATVRALVRSRAADRRLEQAAREWQATFDALADAVVLLGDDGIVLRANRAAGRLFRTEAHDAVGQPLATVLGGVFGGEGEALAQRIAQGDRFEHAIVRLGELTFSVFTEALPLGDGRRSVLVLENVSERLAAEREREALLSVAEQARFEAEEANQSKSQFLAIMSHELRTPLNAIGGYVQLIELGIRGPVTDSQRADLARIKRSQTYLLSLINDVLNFAKIEGGHLQLDPSRLSLGDVIDGMSDFVEPQLRERGLSYTCKRCDPDLFVRADQDKVQQILINLLSNALKFTPAGGHIRLDCTREDSRAAIRVIDSGLGIAPEKLEWIFEPFVQVDRRYKREQEGIGLGLAISRELARAMGGDLTVESTADAGSTFTLHLSLDLDVAQGT